MGTNTANARETAALDELARSGLVRRGALARVEQVVPTGIAALDGLLPGGGLPCGSVTEMAGPASCGKLALAARALAGVLASGERAALVDTARAFFPALSPGLTRALSTLLVCRVPTPLDGLVAAETLVSSGALALVVVDLAGALAVDRAMRSGLARLDRALRENAAAALVVTQPPAGADGLLGASAALRLEVSVDRAGLPGGRLEGRVTVARSRFGPPGASAAIR